VTLAELNVSSPHVFSQTLGWVFEHSPWVAERTWRHRPFRDVPQLHRAMAAEVEAARPEEQLALLRAHPDLGTRARVSQASAAEQASAGLNNLTSDEREALTRLTAAYRERFGFPFLLAVRDASKSDVLDALARRLQASLDVERAEALRQVERIALLRLQDTIEPDPGPPEPQ